MRRRALLVLAAATVLVACQAQPMHDAASTGGSIPSSAQVQTTPIYLPTDLQLSAPSADVAWALVADRFLYRSLDGAATWEQRPIAVPLGLPPEIAFVDKSTGWLLAAGSPETQCNAEAFTLWKTVDGGTFWTKLTAAGVGSAQCKESLWFADATHGFMAAWDDNHRPTVYRTSDGGYTWEGSVLPDPPGFVTQPGGFSLRPGIIRSFGGVVLVAAHGQNATYVFRSSDGGATWSAVSHQGPIPTNVTFVSAARWLGIGNDAEARETTDGGATWHSTSSDYQDAAGVMSTFVFAGPQVGYGTVRGGLQKSVDGGRHWVHVRTPGVVEPG